MAFGTKLYNARLALNLSQVELAEKVGVSERSIYSYEQTGVFPRRPVMKKLADALNVSIAYLMDDEETDRTNINGEELFLANAKSKYGQKGAREAQEILNKATALFAGGELNAEAKDIFMKSLMDVYLESKAEAKERFAPKRRASRKVIENGEARM